MTRKTKNTQGRAADEDKETSAAAEKPREEPATSSQPAHAEAADAASAPDPEGQAADRGAQTSAAAEGPAQGPEATTAPAKTGEADAGSPVPGLTEAEKRAALKNARLPTMSAMVEQMSRSGRLTERTIAAIKSEILGVVPAAQDDEPSGREVVVVGPKRGRWRAGRHFGAEPVRIPVEELTEDEKAALVADPVLIVSVAEVSRRP